MKKIIFLLVFVFLASCTQNSNPTQTETQSNNSHAEQTTTETKTENTENFQKIIDSASKKITQAEYFNLCMKNYVNSCLDATASSMATEKKDTSFCDELSEEISKNSCRLGVILSDMYEHKDATKCDIITEKDLQNSCKTAIIESIALETKDIAKCQELTHFHENPEQKTEQKETCMLKIFASEEKLDIRKCETLTLGHYKSSCVALPNILK